MEMNRKTRIKAIGLTGIIGAFIFGTLWLCLYVSWWFAALWLLLPCYVLICVIYTVAEMRKKEIADYNGRRLERLYRDKQPK